MIYSSRMAGPIAPQPTPFLKAAALLTGLVLVLYGPVVGYAFVNYDDHGYVLESFLLPLDSFEKLARIFSGYYFAQYSPLQLVSYGLDHAVGGYSPWVYHLHNLAYWWGTVLLACWILLRGLGPSLALAAAVLFAVHPMHVEPVCWVAERKGVMSVFYTFASLAVLQAHMAAPRLHTLLASVLLWAAALLSKATALPTGFLFFFYFHWIERRPIRSLWKPALPFAMLTLVIAAVTVQSSDTAGESTLKTEMYGGSLAAALRIMIPIWAGYWHQFLYPVRLELRYLTADFGSFLDPHVMVPLSLLLALAASVVLSWRRGGRGWPFLVTAFYLYMLPVMGLLPINFFRADRYTHGPMLLLCVALAGAVRYAVDWAGRPRLFVPAISMIVLAWSALTLDHRPAWRDSESLWRDMLSKNAYEITYYTNLADVLIPDRRLDEAEAVIAEGRRHFPAHAHLLHGVAMIADAREDYPTALKYYRKAFKADPKQHQAIRRIAEIEWHEGNVEAALSALDEAVQALQRRPEKDQPLRYGRPDPELGELLVSRAAMLGAMGDEEGAARALMEADRVWPDAWQVLNPLALAAWKRGDYPRGAELLERSLQLHPGQPSAGALGEVMDNFRKTGRPPGL